MTKPAYKPFDPQETCRILIKKGFLQQAQAKGILSGYDSVKQKLEKNREVKEKKSGGSSRIINPVTIVDVIDSMNLHRQDKPDRILDEELIFQALADEWKIRFVKIDPLELNLNLVTTTIPRSFAMKHLVLPIAVKDGKLVIATPDPFNTEVMEDIERACYQKVEPVVGAKSDIIKLIDEFFGFKRSIAAAEDQFSGALVDLGNLEQYVRLRSQDELPSNDQHVVNAVNHLFVYAYDQRASDVHIEPKREFSLVRMRIDGVLHNIYQLPKNVHSAIVSRIKNLSRLDMAEKRRPQDGRIKMDRDGVEVEIRISTVPVAFGEKVVMRLMDPDILLQDLDGLGFTPTDLIRYNQFINKPHGIVLICGPTGSGKSTTLYSTLKHLYTPEINIITVEDPIEMICDDFNQIAVQPIVGVTFASILRNILRQDPDMIMIGEMRDRETAENAVQAAMTGHLVFSTLHTNDAPAAVVRLLDLGVPYFLIQTTLVGIMAQRLVRKICDRCVKHFQIDTSELENMGLKIGRSGKITLFHGEGCRKCRGTGYYGRTSIFEVLPYTESLKRVTTPKTDVKEMSSAAKKEGIVTLRENAVQKLIQGVTTYQEVLRVTWDQG